MMSTTRINKIDMLITPENKCKGKVYRARVSSFASVESIGKHVRLHILKRKSCPGCEECGHFHDQLPDTSEDWPIGGLDSVEDNGVYRLCLGNFTYDVETGEVNDYNVMLKPYTEKSDEI